jgi:poly(A) polymerase
MTMARIESKDGGDAWSVGTGLVTALRTAGHGAWFVGGAVRDRLLGRHPEDIDLATTATPDELLHLFPDAKLVGMAFGVVNVVRGGKPFEIATLRQERRYEDGRRPSDVKFTRDPAVDARRRDFTINGMFLDPQSGDVLDLVGGREDLRHGMVRTIGDPIERFTEDYLRPLRAVRFAARLDFSLAPDLAAAAAKFAGNLSLLAAERVRDELDRMLGGPAPDRAIRLLHETGMLGQILPDVAAMDGVPQPVEFHPEGDVLTHTLLMLGRLCRPDADTAWTALLHDVGKPSTLSRDEAGVEHFYRHEEVGAALAAQILDRLRLPKRRIEHIVHAIGGHMRYARVAEMRPAKWKRMLAAPTFALELELHRIDCASSHGRMDNVLFLLDRHRELATTPPVPPPLINGHDLLALGMFPGPDIGRLLNAVADQQLEGILASREDALAWAKTVLADGEDKSPDAN